MRRPLLAALAGVLVLVLGAGCARVPLADRWYGGSMMRGHHHASTSCTVPSLPGQVVHVVLADMRMPMMRAVHHRMVLRAFPARVRPGRVTLLAVNHGWRRHELVVLPLAPGEAAGDRAPGADRRVSEAGSLGEASATCAAGAGEGIRPGAAGWVTLKLPAGRYELVCNLRGHYAAGMHQLLVVR